MKEGLSFRLLLESGYYLLHNNQGIDHETHTPRFFPSAITKRSGCELVAERCFQ
jgi:hypothetical protein